MSGLRNTPRLIASQNCALLVSAYAALCAIALALHADPRAHAAAPLAGGHTYHVTSTVDAPDADVGDGICASASNGCTLRAAIMQANFLTGLDTITVPSGTYLLTRPGDDDAAVLGDLDILDDLTIQGAGSGVTIVDGNGAVTGGRVFQIFAVRQRDQPKRFNHSQWQTDQPHV